MPPYSMPPTLVPNGSGLHEPIYAVTLDLETAKLAADLPGGWPALLRGEGGISALVLWSAISGRPHLFDEHNLSDCASFIEHSGVLLTFNGEKFDIPLLEAVLGKKLSIPFHLDMLQLIWSAFPPGRRQKGNSLDEVAKRTLGEGKDGEAIMAPQLYENGMFATLFDYCLQDVALTRRLFLFAQEHGGIIGPDGDMLPLSLPEWFGEAVI